ncbi:hypothetical protein ADUPG1_005439, partial [Aduncisulcus paluster]
IDSNAECLASFLSAPSMMASPIPLGICGGMCDEDGSRYCLPIPIDYKSLEESVNTLQQRFTKGKFKDIHEVFSVALKRCMFVLAAREYVSAEKDKGEKPLGEVGVLQKCQEYISAIK